MFNGVAFPEEYRESLVGVNGELDGGGEEGPIARGTVKVRLSGILLSSSPEEPLPGDGT